MAEIDHLPVPVPDFSHALRSRSDGHEGIAGIDPCYELFQIGHSGGKKLLIFTAAEHSHHGSHRRIMKDPPVGDLLPVEGSIGLICGTSDCIVVRGKGLDHRAAALLPAACPSDRLRDQLICPQYIRKEDEYYLLPYCDHAIVPHLRAENLKVLEKYQTEIEESLSRFRESKNLTWLIYPLNLMMNGQLQNGTVKTHYTALRDENSINNLDFTDCDVIVLNDEYHGNYYYGKTLLLKRLEEVLPGKSTFEK